MFRTLNPQEQRQFREWVRQFYVPFDPIPGWWHPVAQEEARRINEVCGKAWAQAESLAQ